MEDKEKTKNDEKNNSTLTKKLLNTLLAIIVIITVVAGSVIYYHLYKYSAEEIETTESTQEASTVAEIINTAIDQTSNTESSTLGTGNTTVSTSDADSRKVLNEEIIVLYDGLVLDVSEAKIVDLQYIDNSSSDKENYVITYYNYENFGYVNSSLGIISSQILDGLVKVDNVGKVAISENYEAIPRDIQVINSIPAVVLDNNSDFTDYDTKKTIIMDLDGNDTNEYIVILVNKTTGESKIVLAESTGIVKATLATMDKSGWDSVSTDGYYLSYNNIEVVDVDNDSIMEILIELPTTSSTPSKVSLLKYNNGELSGKTDTVCTLVSSSTD